MDHYARLYVLLASLRSSCSCEIRAWYTLVKHDSGNHCQISLITKNFYKRNKDLSILCFNLKVLQSDKLCGDGQIFQVWPYLNSLIMIKLPFSQQEHLQIFPTSLAK